MRRWPEMIVAILLLNGCAGLSAPSALHGALQQSAARGAHGASVTYTPIYTFDQSNGAAPIAALVETGGTLYGTASEGGANGDGVVFGISTAGSLVMHHDFAGGMADGAEPEAPLLAVKDKLYGTTAAGGLGSGTVFTLATSGKKEKLLHSFAGAPGDGALPEAGLIAVNGVFYGTTVSGGAHNGGCVFSITKNGSESVLYSFSTGDDGGYPYGGLVDVKGTLYGTTQGGGANGHGTVFAIAPGGTESVVYSFKGQPDGGAPMAGLLYAGGLLYGTTLVGGTNQLGSVFSLTPAGKETVLYSFAGGADGESPYTALIELGGTFYGTTYGGGSGSEGTIFSVSKKGKEAVVFSLPGSAGAQPLGALLGEGSTLYGTGRQGGTYGDGLVFQLAL